MNIFKMDDTRKVNETVEMALEWLNKSWVLIDGDTDFGRDGANASPYAKKTWDDITDLKAQFEREVDGFSHALTHSLETWTLQKNHRPRVRCLTIVC